MAMLVITKTRLLWFVIAPWIRVPSIHKELTSESVYLNDLATWRFWWVLFRTERVILHYLRYFYGDLWWFIWWFIWWFMVELMAGWWFQASWDDDPQFYENMTHSWVFFHNCGSYLTDICSLYSNFISWLVVSTLLENDGVRQLGILKYGNIIQMYPNVPNHQPACV